MKLTYDPKHNIAYIRLREKKQSGVESVKISEELVVDMSPDGTIYGIELLNANKQLCDKRSLHFQFINEANGKTKKLKIA